MTKRTIKEINEKGELVLDNGDILSLKGANLKDVNFCHSNLKRACLNGTDLREVDLANSDLRYVYFAKSHLNDADFGDYELVLKSKEQIALMRAKGVY